MSIFTIPTWPTLVPLANKSYLNGDCTPIVLMYELTLQMPRTTRSSDTTVISKPPNPTFSNINEPKKPQWA
jgi:hypothetical protein